MLAIEESVRKLSLLEPSEFIMFTEGSIKVSMTS